MSTSAVKRGVPGTFTGIVVVLCALLAASYFLASAWRIEALRTDPYALHVVAHVTWIHPLWRGSGTGWGSYTVLGRFEDNVPLDVGEVPLGTPVTGLVDPADPGFFLRDGTTGYDDLVAGLAGVAAAITIAWWVYRWRRAWTAGYPLPMFRFSRTSRSQSTTASS